MPDRFHSAQTCSMILIEQVNMKLIELKIYRAKESEEVTSRNIRLYYAIHGETMINDSVLNDGELLAVNPNETHQIVYRKGIAAA